MHHTNYVILHTQILNLDTRTHQIQIHPKDFTVSLTTVLHHHPVSSYQFWQNHIVLITGWSYQYELQHPLLPTMHISYHPHRCSPILQNNDFDWSQLTLSQKIQEYNHLRYLRQRLRHTLR